MDKQNKSRRWFLSGGLTERKEMVKMLTPDGKLVLVERSIVEKAPKEKVTNQDILKWMNNPSKKDM